MPFKIREAYTPCLVYVSVYKTLSNNPDIDIHKNDDNGGSDMGDDSTL